MDDLQADASSPAEIPATPPFQAEATPPPGVPPLIPAHLAAGFEKALGGRPVAMKIGRPAATAAPLPGLPAAATLSGTFTGAPAIDPAARAAILQARQILGRVITAIAEADAKLPAVLEAIAPHAQAALAVENFDLAEATAFHRAASAALKDLQS